MMIGVDLGGTNARAGLVDDEGRLIKTYKVELSEKHSHNGTLEQLYSVVSPLIHSNVEGIGIGVPSVVDAELGIVYDVVNIPGWKRVELKRILEEKFGIPVYVNNDVNCLALGEQTFGEGARFSSFVSLVIGTGLGAAIVIDGRLYTGMYCGSGEIGYIPYLDKNLEHYASGRYFEDYSTTAYAAYQAALSGDSNAHKLWRSYGHHLGEVIKIVMYTYAPEAVILSGGLANAYRFFEPSMRRSMNDFLFSQTLNGITIIPSAIENIAIMGAAALVRAQR